MAFEYSLQVRREWLTGAWPLRPQGRRSRPVDRPPQAGTVQLRPRLPRCCSPATGQDEKPQRILIKLEEVVDYQLPGAPSAASSTTIWRA